MTGDTLREFDRLVTAGFSEEQARALVEVVGAPARTDPEVMETLNLVVQRLDGIDQRLVGIDRRLGEHGRLLENMLPLVQMIPAMAYEIGGIKQRVDRLDEHYGPIQEDQHEIRAELHVVGERVKMEGRVARMINLALIAIGATAASLLAVFAR